MTRQAIHVGELRVSISDVKTSEARLASRPIFLPRPRSRQVALGLKHLTSAWPRSC